MKRERERDRKRERERERTKIMTEKWDMTKKSVMGQKMGQKKCYPR